MLEEFSIVKRPVSVYRLRVSKDFGWSHSFDRARRGESIVTNRELRGGTKEFWLPMGEIIRITRQPLGGGQVHFIATQTKSSDLSPQVINNDRSQSVKNSPNSPLPKQIVFKHGKSPSLLQYITPFKCEYSTRIRTSRLLKSQRCNTN